MESHLKTGGEVLEYANRAGATRIAAEVAEVSFAARGDNDVMACGGGVQCSV